MSERYEQVEVTTRAGWRSWLAHHHGSAPGVWVVTYKAGSGGPRVPYDDIVEEALAHGWVDSLPRALDDERTQLLVTPRRPASNWSRANKQRIERLEHAGLMADAGRAAVEVARRNGSWTALDEVEDLVEPDDLATALDADPDARRHFDAFPRSVKRGILEWILNAKRDDTRHRRISETTRLAARDVRANHPRQPKGRGGRSDRS